MSSSLAKKLSIHSGLDDAFFNSEFSDLLTKYGKNKESITLSELREILAQEMQSLLLDLKKNCPDC